MFLIDHENFDIRGRWEIDRGPQQLAYEAWWHLGHDTMVTSEWGLPATFENGLVPEILLGGNYDHKLHFWGLHTRKHQQEIDFGAENQLVFELRPAHDPTKAFGFVNSVVSLKDLSSSIWVWFKEGKNWAIRKIIEIPAEPAEPDLLPPMLKGFKAVPPLVTDIDLSDAIGVKLLVDHAIKRVGEIHPPSVTADLHHLRPAVKLPVGGLRVPLP